MAVVVVNRHRDGMEPLFELLVDDRKALPLDVVSSARSFGTSRSPRVMAGSSIASKHSFSQLSS